MADVAEGKVESTRPTGIAAPADWPVLVCLLGGFRVLAAGEVVGIPPESKPGLLLRRLAMAGQQGVPRAELMGLLWGDADDQRAGGRFHTLLTEVRKALRGALEGDSPFLNGDGCYRLNKWAGVGVDVACFDAAFERGEQAFGAGQADAAGAAYDAAIAMYQGDLYVGGSQWEDLHAFMEQERLRSRCLVALGRAADLASRAGDAAGALALAWRMLAIDPCAEVAHRLVLHNYARQGQSFHALRHYRACAEILRREYGSQPEPDTQALFDLIRRGAWTAEAGARLIRS
jgi:DNA-binding SARP family transcriptional activator